MAVRTRRIGFPLAHSRKYADVRAWENPVCRIYGRVRDFVLASHYQCIVLLPFDKCDERENVVESQSLYCGRNCFRLSITESLQPDDRRKAILISRYSCVKSWYCE